MAISVVSFITLATCIFFSHFIFVNATCNPYSCNDNGYCSGSGDDTFCICDIGFKSSVTSDCDTKICPKGDDPVTKNQNFRVISLSLVSNDENTMGKAEFSFLGENTFFDANPWTLTNEKLVSSLRLLKNINDIDITGGNVDRQGSSTYTITFTSWPTLPYENNVHYHNGNPHISSFSCKSLVDDISCSIRDIKTPYTSIIEYVTCSNHGRCNGKTGECECELGWSGDACDNNEDSLDVQMIVSDGPNFSGNILKLQSRAESEGSSFHFINAIAGRKEKSVFSLEGNGNVHMTGDLNIKSGSARIQGKKGITIETSSSTNRAIEASSPGGAAKLHGSGSDFSSSVLLLSVDDTAPSNGFKFLEAKTVSSDKSLFEVDGNGHISSSGATVGVGGIVMTEGNLKLRNGSGIVIEKKGGLTVEDGSSLFEASNPSSPVVVISRNNHLENNNSRTSSPLLLVENKEEQFQEENHHDLIEIKTGETSVFRVDASGMARFRGGVQVENGSVDILSGGLNVISGGVSIEGGIDLKSGSLKIENQASLEIFGGIESVVSSSSSSAFTGKVTDPSYSGIVLNMEGPEGSSDSKYKFLQISSTSSNEDLFSVDSKGEVYAKGIHSDGDISSEKNLNIRGGASMQKRSIPASDAIKVDDISSITFLEITDDNHEAKNNLFLLGTPLENQLLFVKNSDLQALNGYDLGDIPPLTLILFIYMDSQGWVDVTATAAHKRDLTGVTKLEAVNDLDIGKNALSSAKLIVTSKSKANDLGQIVFFGSGGVLRGDKGISYNPETETLSVSKVSASDFVGDSLDFHGGIISSATLVNITIENLKYLVVENLGIKSEATDNGDESRSKMALIDNRGTLSATKDILWDKDKRQLLVQEISSQSPKGIKIEADINMNFQTIRNAVIEEGTILKKLHFEDGIISNSILNNVTAKNLKLGDVEVESIAVSTLSNLQNTGTLITIGQSGQLISSESFMEHEGKLQVTKEVQFKESIDLGYNDIRNAKIAGRSIIKGQDVVIDVKSVMADSIGLLENKDSFSTENQQESLLVIGKDGKFKRGSISLKENGVLQSLEVGQLQVNEKSVFQVGVEVNGDTFIDGSLTVSASVLGSGPYVDVSDIRFKKAITPLSSSDSNNGVKSTLLQKILKLRGVTYELNDNAAKLISRPAKKSQEIGFIAQEVEDLFPNLVDTRKDGFKGLKYARFVPVITEGFKELYQEMKELRRENDELRASIRLVMGKVNELEAKLK